MAADSQGPWGGEGRQAGSRAVRPPSPVRPLLRPGNQFILFCLCSLNTQQRLDRAVGQGSCRHCQVSLKVGRKPSQRGGACLPEASGTAPDRQAGRVPEKRTHPCRPHTKAKMRLSGSHSGLDSGYRSALRPGLTREGQVARPTAFACIASQSFQTLLAFWTHLYLLKGTPV